MSIFRRTGGQLRQLMLGPGGIDFTAGEALLGELASEGIHPRMLYVMPTFHNPTGLTLDEAQRRALLEFASRFDLIVLEDDAYRDLYYDADSGRCRHLCTRSIPTAALYAQAPSPRSSRPA